MTMGKTPKPFGAGPRRCFSRMEMSRLWSPPLFGHCLDIVWWDEDAWRQQTYAAVQMDELRFCGEGNGRERVGVLAVVQLSQHTTVVDLDVGLCQRRHHCCLHGWVCEAGGSEGLGGRQDQLDTRATHAQVEQSLHGGVNVQVVTIDDGIVCRAERWMRDGIDTYKDIAGI